MKTTSNDNQLSLFDLTPPPVVAAPAEYDVPAKLQEYWSNSMDLAFSLINKLFDELFEEDRQKLVEFVEYVKACRLAQVADEAQRPVHHEQFHHLAECLKRLEFTLEESGENGETILTETTVLDFAVDVSFDENELRELRAFEVAGASIQQVEGLAEAIRNYVEEDAESKDESPEHPYFAMLRQLDISKESMPEASDKNAVLKAMLDGIGTSAEKFEWVISSTDITQAELLAAGGPAERKRLNKLLANKLAREMACFSGTERWYRHGGFWQYEILLTEGVMHLAEHGGRNNGTRSG